MKTSEQINEIAKAMAEAQGKMKPASKDSTNPHFKSRYSDISSVWDAIRVPVTSVGITIWQDVQTDELGISVTTRLVHTSGQWVEFGPLKIPVPAKTSHAIGSAISYAKRYALCASIGVVSGDEDDDGNQAAKEKTEKPTENLTKEPVEIINKKQFDDLYVLLQKCNTTFVENLTKYLKGQGVNSIGTLPTHMYESVFAWTKKESGNEQATAS